MQNLACDTSNMPLNKPSFKMVNQPSKILWSLGTVSLIWFVLMVCLHMDLKQDSWAEDNLRSRSHPKDVEYKDIGWRSKRTTPKPQKYDLDKIGMEMYEHMFIPDDRKPRKKKVKFQKIKDASQINTKNRILKSTSGNTDSLQQNISSELNLQSNTANQGKGKKGFISLEEIKNYKASDTVDGYIQSKAQKATTSKFKLVVLRDRPFTKDEVLDFENSQRRHSFNVTASELVPFGRDIKDYRQASCSSKYSELTSPLPTASVIICFHNEAWSTLLRTVHSVLHTAPTHLLREVILVDDASTYDYLGAHLETHLKTLPNVFLLRTGKREGLIRARLLGVSYARGDVLVFLDSHCECAPHWLQPLLWEIQHKRRKVVSPMIDIVDYNTFEYKPAPVQLHGTFDWTLQFLWKPLPQHEVARRKSPSDTIRSPTMIGGLFAVDKQYFLHMGAYDSFMDIWGGENIELSFRIWMCGGSVEIVPCSHVGHVFRRVIPYSFPAGGRSTIQRNTMRVAEVWMDNYKNLYYAAQNISRNSSIVLAVRERQRLRTALRCRSFQWYLDNVVPEMVIPRQDVLFFGQISFLSNKELCLQWWNNTLRVKPCTAQLSQQIFQLSTVGRLHHEDFCVGGHQDYMTLPVICSRLTTRWRHTKDNQLEVTFSKGVMTTKCLALTNPNARMLTYQKCSDQTKAQKWKFTHYFEQEKLHMLYL